MDMPHAIVVDVSLARAAGQTEDRIALACVEVLDAISRNGHLLAMSAPLRDEWLKSRSGHGEPYLQYASMYAFDWWHMMVTKRKVVWIDLSQNSETRDRILGAVSPENLSQVKKDLHLIETALASDHRVVSLDDKIRKRFSALGRAVVEICAVLWLNPKSDAVSIWLEHGAPDEERYRLCDR